MKTKKEKIIVLSLAFLSMSLLGMILECYRLLNDEKETLDISSFNNILLKSFVISFIVIVVIFLTNYKKFKDN